LSYWDPEDQACIASEILRYFLRNPRAADSLEGITRWRLLDERIYRTLEETARALDGLVGKGLLVTEESTGLAERLFRLDPNKLADVEQFLKKNQKSGRRRRRRSTTRYGKS